MVILLCEMKNTASDLFWFQVVEKQSFIFNSFSHGTLNNTIYLLLFINTDVCLSTAQEA